MDQKTLNQLEEMRRQIKLRDDLIREGRSSRYLLASLYNAASNLALIAGVYVAVCLLAIWVGFPSWFWALAGGPALFLAAGMFESLKEAQGVKGREES